MPRESQCSKAEALLCCWGTAAGWVRGENRCCNKGMEASSFSTLTMGERAKPTCRSRPLLGSMAGRKSHWREEIQQNRRWGSRCDCRGRSTGVTGSAWMPAAAPDLDRQSSGCFDVFRLPRVRSGWLWPVLFLILPFGRGASRSDPGNSEPRGAGNPRRLLFPAEWRTRNISYPETSPAPSPLTLLHAAERV